MADAGRAEKETLAIPADVRAVVDERDQMHCRVCGKYLGDRRAHHHVIYGGTERGMGGRRVHNADEIITVCWMPGDPAPGMRSCHELVHSDKPRFQALLLMVIGHPGATALQLERWQGNRKRRKR